MSATVAAAAFVPVAITTALTNVGSGFLVDHMRSPRAAGLGVGDASNSYWMVPYLSTVTLAMAFGVSFGMPTGYSARSTP